MSSARVSLTYPELVRLRDLQGAAWGSYTSAYKKLDAAVKKIEESEARPST